MTHLPTLASRPRLLGAISLGCLFLLAGCDPNFVQTQQDLASDANKSQELYGKTNKVLSKQSFVEHTGNYMVANKSFQIEEDVVLPPIFNKNLIYSSAKKENLPTILSELYAQTGVKFKFSPDAIHYLQGGGQNNSSDTTNSNSSEVDTQGSVEIGSGEVAANVGVLKSIQMNLQYEGTLKKLMDRFASGFNVYWEYDPKTTTVVFFRTQTKVFAIDLLPGETTFSNQFSSSSTLGGSSSGASGGEGGGSGGGSGSLNSGAVMDVAYKQLENNAWKDTVTTVTNMLSPEGKVTPNPRSGYVTVTDIPERLDSIESFINKINDKARRKIAVKVDVFDVELTAKTDYGVDWNAIIDAWGGNITLDPIKNPTASPLGNPNVTDTFKFNYVGSGFFDAADVIFRALSQQGNTAKVTGTTVYTVNGEPAPVQVVTRSDYVQQITFSAISDQSSTTEVAITPGTVVSGFFMVVTPTILSDHQILLNMSISLSTADITTNKQTVCGSGQTTNCPEIALPIVKSKNFMESVTLNPGQTVILSGFQDTENKVGVESVAAPQFWALGGSKATNSTKVTTVTVITPYLVGR